MTSPRESSILIYRREERVLRDFSERSFSTVTIKQKLPNLNLDLTGRVRGASRYLICTGSPCYACFPAADCVVGRIFKRPTEFSPRPRDSRARLASFRTLLCVLSPQNEHALANFPITARRFGRRVHAVRLDYARRTDENEPGQLSVNSKPN